MAYDQTNAAIRERPNLQMVLNRVELLGKSLAESANRASLLAVQLGGLEAEGPRTDAPVPAPDSLLDGMDRGLMALEAEADRISRCVSRLQLHINGGPPAAITGAGANFTVKSLLRV